MVTNPVLGSITVYTPGKAERSYLLQDGGVLKIGRDDQNDIIILDSSVSRAHAVINTLASRTTITDLFSTNGTFVNGVRIQEVTQISAGDIVTIGASRIAVERDENAKRPRTRTETLVKGVRSVSLPMLLVVPKNIPCGANWSAEATRTLSDMGVFIDLSEGKGEILCSLPAAIDGGEPLLHSLQSVLATLEALTAKGVPSLAYADVFPAVAVSGPDGKQQVTLMADPLPALRDIHDALTGFATQLYVTAEVAHATGSFHRFVQIASFGRRRQQEPRLVLTFKEGAEAI